MSMGRKLPVYELSYANFRNHQTKYRLICTQFDHFFILITYMDTTFSNSETFYKILFKKMYVPSAFDSCVKS